MGKTKDGSPAAKAAKPTPGTGPSPEAKSTAPATREPSRARKLVPFFANLTRADLYKPVQGKRARGLTAAALGITVALGLVHIYDRLDSYGQAVRYGVPALTGVVLGWCVFRLINYGPFAEFLIATEAEMNKVSWTTRDDLKRATAVVLTTVFVLSVFLFAVDWTWSTLLQWIGVLQFDGGGGFGSTG